MGNITIQGDITATVPGNAVGGASALTTVGSVPFVTASGVLGQSANLFWDNANGRLNLGSTVRANGQVLNMYESGNIRYGIGVATSALRIYNPGTGNNTVFGTVSTADGSTFAEQMRLVGGTGNLLLGTTTDDGTNRLQVAGGARLGGFLLDNGATFGATDPIIVNSGVASVSTNFAFTQNALGQTVFNGSVIDFRTANVQRARFAATSGNLLLGTTTDGGFKLDVADSGSSGGLRVWDQRATIGSTSFVVRAGAGQTGNLFSVRNASNVEQFWVNAFGPEANNFIAVTRFRTNSNEVGIEATSGLDLASNRLIRYSSTTDYSGTKDLSLSRASAGTLQVGDGGANANGTVNAASARLNGGGFTVENTAVNLGSVSVSSNARQLLITGQPQDPTLGLVAPLTVNAVANGAANRKLFQLGIAGVEAFSVDVEGDVVTAGVFSIGTALSNDFRLDVGSSGSSGTARLWDQRATIGSTSLVVRAGAGQGSNNLTTWQNSSGSTLTSISFAGRLETSAGVFFTNSFGAVLGPLPSNMGGGKGIAIGFDNPGDGAVFARQYLLQGATATTTDTGIARFAAGRLELNSGTAIGTTPGNARDIMARGFYAAETTTDPSAADLTIAGSNTQDVAAIYVKNDKLVVAYNRSGTVNYLTIPLDGATTTFTQSTTAP